MEYYPPTAFHFKVSFELNGATRHDLNFQEVAGLSYELGVETITEGGENRFPHRLPAAAKYPNLVLKRGLVNDSGLVKWLKSAVEDLDITPADITVSLLDETQAALVNWSFVKAWPVKWSLANFNAQNNALAIETIELAYQYFRRM